MCLSHSPHTTGSRLSTKNGAHRITKVKKTTPRTLVAFCSSLMIRPCLEEFLDITLEFLLWWLRMVAALVWLLWLVYPLYRWIKQGDDGFLSLAFIPPWPFCLRVADLRRSSGVLGLFVELLVELQFAIAEVLVLPKLDPRLRVLSQVTTILVGEVVPVWQRRGEVIRTRSSSSASSSEVFIWLLFSLEIILTSVGFGVGDLSFLLNPKYGQVQGGGNGNDDSESSVDPWKLEPRRHFHRDVGDSSWQLRVSPSWKVDARLRLFHGETVSGTRSKSWFSFSVVDLNRQEHEMNRANANVCKYIDRAFFWPRARFLIRKLYIGIQPTHIGASVFFSPLCRCVL